MAPGLLLTVRTNFDEVDEVWLTQSLDLHLHDDCVGAAVEVDARCGIPY